MTPEEKAVIEAAIVERNSLWNMFATGQDSPLVAAIDALVSSRASVDIVACPECLTDPNEDPLPWCDCASDETCSGPCRRRAHTPQRCPGRDDPNQDDCHCSRTERVYCHAENCHGGADLCPNCAPLLAGASATRIDGTSEVEASRDCDCSAWVPATFGELLPGDRVRIGTQEADVTKVNRGQWHARNRVWIDDAGKERDHQTPWEHEELNIDLTANPGMHTYPPDLSCELLADEERRAVLTLQRAFEGTKPVDSSTGIG